MHKLHRILFLVVTDMLAQDPVLVEGAGTHEHSRQADVSDVLIDMVFACQRGSLSVIQYPVC